MHRYRTPPRRGGFIGANQVLHHDAKPGDEIGHCAICGQMIWVNVVTIRFTSLYPEVPVLCCWCAGQSLEVLRRALPAVDWTGTPVPDLARQGVFN